MRIPTPAEHKKKNSNYKAPFAQNYVPKWYVNTVICTLRNKTHIGTLEKGKPKRISYKVRKKDIIRENERRVCENEYEAIISKKIL